jgi:hypothetical protein
VVCSKSQKGKHDVNEESTHHGLIGRTSLQLVISRLEALAFAALEEALVALRLLPILLHTQVLLLDREVGLGVRAIEPKNLWGCVDQLARLELFGEYPVLELRLESEPEFYQAVLADLKVTRDPGRLSLELGQEVHGLILVAGPEPPILPGRRVFGPARFSQGPFPDRLFDIAGVRSVRDDLGKLGPNEITEKGRGRHFESVVLMRLTLRHRTLFPKFQGGLQF